MRANSSFGTCSQRRARLARRNRAMTNSGSKDELRLNHFNSLAVLDSASIAVLGPIGLFVASKRDPHSFAQGIDCVVLSIITICLLASAVFAVMHNGMLVDNQSSRSPR